MGVSGAKNPQPGTAAAWRVPAPREHDWLIWFGRGRFGRSSGIGPFCRRNPRDPEPGRRSAIDELSVIGAIGGDGAIGQVDRLGAGEDRGIGAVMDGGRADADDVAVFAIPAGYLRDRVDPGAGGVAGVAEKVAARRRGEGMIQAWMRATPRSGMTMWLKCGGR